MPHQRLEPVRLHRLVPAHLPTDEGLGADVADHAHVLVDAVAEPVDVQRGRLLGVRVGVAARRGGALRFGGSERVEQRPDHPRCALLADHPAAQRTDRIAAAIVDSISARTPSKLSSGA